MKRKLLIIAIVVITLIFLSGIGLGYFYSRKSEGDDQIYSAFTAEIYEKIKNNYWEKITDEELSRLFKMGAEKITGEIQVIEEKNKEGVKKLVEKIIKNKKEKEEITSRLSSIVLANLKPIGRSALYTEKKKEELVQRVNNIDSETGERKSTVNSKIVSYQESSQGILNPKVAYIKISRISPTTFEEFKEEASKIDIKGGEELDSLVIDLRGNVGGSVDILPYFLGPFIGNDQYAYELYSQGEKIPFKTKTGWLNSLVRYKKVVILIDGETQSSAEVLASVLKKYNVGVLVGKVSRGWGTIEKVFSLENQISLDKKYSLFLVHSLTLRQDGQPIEGRGVNPVISLNDEDWEKKLFSHFESEKLIEALKKVIN